MNSEIKRSNLIAILALIAVLTIIHLLTQGQYTDALGNNYTKIIEQKQFYRLITSIFLHADFGHLFHNCLSLLIIGLAYTRRNSLFKFFLIYFIGGLCGNIGSLVYHGIILRDTDTYSIGASGAIFGVLGALVLYSLLREHGRDRYGALMYALIVFLLGFENFSTDNAAHFCGLIGGFIAEGIKELFDSHEDLSHTIF